MALVILLRNLSRTAHLELAQPQDCHGPPGARDQPFLPVSLLGYAFAPYCEVRDSEKTFTKALQ